MKARILVSLCSFGHALLGLGIGWGIGPVAYDPESMMVRGKPASMEPGLEKLFPRLLGCLYVSLSVGLLYAVLMNTTEAMRAALLPCICYHCGAGLDAFFGWNSAAINAEKMDPNEPLVGHSVFLTLSTVAFILSGMNTMIPPEREKKD